MQLRYDDELSKKDGHIDDFCADSMTKWVY